MSGQLVKLLIPNAPAEGPRGLEMPQKHLAGKAQSKFFEAFAATLNILSKVLSCSSMNG